MINCSFLPVMYKYHQCIKAGKPPLDIKDFMTIENMWMCFYGLGKFETAEEAIAREKYFKTAPGRRYLKKKLVP